MCKKTILNTQKIFAYFFVLTIGLSVSSCYKNDFETVVEYENAPIFYVDARLGSEVLDIKVGENDYLVDSYNTQMDFWTATINTYGTKFWSANNTTALLINIANTAKKPFSDIVRPGEFSFLTYQLSGKEGVEVAIIRDGQYYSSRSDDDKLQTTSVFNIQKIEPYELGEDENEYYKVTFSISCVLSNGEKQLPFESKSMTALLQP